MNKRKSEDDTWHSQSLVQATATLRVDATVLKAIKSDMSEEHILEVMNKKYCVLPIGGKTRVVTWGEDPDLPPGHEIIVMASTLEDFAALHNKYRVAVQVWDKNGNQKTKPEPLGRWWINHPERRQYDRGMRFMPHTEEKVVGDVMNTWRGFAVQARKPEGRSGAAGCQLFLDHGLNVICNGTEEHFDFLIKREAFIVQKRIRSEVAVGLKTEIEGTGKGTWERYLNHLYGASAMQIQKPQHLIGKHNQHLEMLLRLTADEALFALNHEHKNILYGLITEPDLTIEPKFVSAYKATNYLNISLTSNADHFAPATGSARRLFVPTVAPDRAGDHEYFRKINVQMSDEGGCQALLYHLLYEVDLRDFNIRAIPKTAALAEQVAYSRKGIDLLVEKACHEARVPCQGLPGYSVCSRWGDRRERESFDDFIDHHPDNELKRMQALMVKRRLAKEWGCKGGDAARKTVAGWHVHGLVWPPLADLRKKFEEKYGKQQWTCEATEWQEDIWPVYPEEESQQGQQKRSKKGEQDDDIPF